MADMSIWNNRKRKASLLAWPNRRGLRHDGSAVTADIGGARLQRNTLSTAGDITSGSVARTGLNNLIFHCN
jgi:hypothetical protein